MVLPHFTSWRTSLAGAGALIYAAADLITMFHNKEWDPNRLGASVMALLTGFGLISARDSAASVQAHAVQKVEIAQNQTAIADIQQVAEVAAAHAAIANQEIVVAKQEVAALTAAVEPLVMAPMPGSTP
jgi:hypothetical protein